MQIEPHVSALQSDLVSLAAPGGPESSAIAERLATAIGPALSLRLLDLLGDAATELDAQLPSGAVEVHLAGREPQLRYVPTGDAPTISAAGRDGDGDEPGARITLRLPERLKSLVESAAARDGVSVNTWLVRAVSRSLDAPSITIVHPGQRRLRGRGTS